MKWMKFVCKVRSFIAIQTYYKLTFKIIFPDHDTRKADICIGRAEQLWTAETLTIWLYKQKAIQN